MFLFDRNILEQVSLSMLQLPGPTFGAQLLMCKINDKII
jgi:hypothetical protein